MTCIRSSINFKNQNKREYEEYDKKSRFLYHNKIFYETQRNINETFLYYELVEALY